MKKRREHYSLMREYEVDTLGRYNAEVARGIVHTEEWKTKMAGYQERFNKMQGSDFVFPPKLSWWFKWRS